MARATATPAPTSPARSACTEAARLGPSEAAGGPRNGYRRGLEILVDQPFRVAQAALGASVPCARGCSSCCAALFDIHPADAALLGAWLDGASDADRQDVVARALDVVGAVAREAGQLAAAGDLRFEGWVPEDGLGALPPDAVTTLAGRLQERCPILAADGSCRAHAHRPAICRLQGLSWRDPVTGSRLPDFCRIDERQASNPDVDADLAALDGLRHESGLAALAPGAGDARVGRGRTFVAQALVRWASSREQA